MRTASKRDFLRFGHQSRLRRPSPLPVTAKIDAGLSEHRQPHDLVHLIAVTIPAVILAPRGFLSEPQPVWRGDVVMVADLAAPHAAEIAFGHIGVDLLGAA